MYRPQNTGAAPARWVTEVSPSVPLSALSLARLVESAPQPNSSGWLYYVGTHCQPPSESPSKTGDLTDCASKKRINRCLASISILAWHSSQIPEAGRGSG